jgi:hypothetical protein
MGNSYRVSENMVERRVRNEHILVPLARTEATLDSIFTLNPSASFIWGRLAANLPTDRIAAELQAEYAVDAATAERDVAATVSQLLAIGALEPAT